MITARPKHLKLAKLVERKIVSYDRKYCRHFLIPLNAIVVLDEAGLLKPGLGRLEIRKRRVSTRKSAGKFGAKKIATPRKIILASVSTGVTVLPVLSLSGSSRR